MKEIDNNMNVGDYIFRFKLLLIGCMAFQLSLYSDPAEEVLWIQPQEVDAFENHFHHYDDAPAITLRDCVKDFGQGFVSGSIFGGSMKSLDSQKIIDPSFATKFFVQVTTSIGLFSVCLESKEHAKQAVALFAGFGCGSMLSFLALCTFDHEYESYNESDSQPLKFSYGG